MGNTRAITRLGIPALKMQDGPQGFRTTGRTGEDGTSTAWPSALTIGASWDADLAYRWASAMGQEFKAKGANMHLGPGIGIARVPTAVGFLLFYFPCLSLCLLFFPRVETLNTSVERILCWEKNWSEES